MIQVQYASDLLTTLCQHALGSRPASSTGKTRPPPLSSPVGSRSRSGRSIAGVPVEGEAGIGYRLSAGFDLPPIMFTMDEVGALVAGARIALALPKARREEVDRTRLFAPGFHIPQAAAAGLETIRQAILQRRKLRIEYGRSRIRTGVADLPPVNRSQVVCIILIHCGPEICFLREEML